MLAKNSDMLENDRPLVRK